MRPFPGRREIDQLRTAVAARRAPAGRSECGVRRPLYASRTAAFPAALHACFRRLGPAAQQWAIAGTGACVCTAARIVVAALASLARSVQTSRKTRATPRPLRNIKAYMGFASESLEINIENLHKAYFGHTVLEGISIDIRRGDVVALVGGSGCGKTVLLNHILGLINPDRGRVRVADHDLADMPLRDIHTLSQEERDRVHAHWGVVFQRNALFTGTVYDNIALWLRENRHLHDSEIRPIARAALKAVGLPHEDEFLVRNHETLSGGMAKRLAVARAVAIDPAVVFYDEPTTGLDPMSSAQIHDLIASTHAKSDYRGVARTTVIITHDKDLLIRLRPRIIMLHDGHVHFDGSFEDFEGSDSAVIRPYFELMPELQQRQFRRAS
jgi:phospholipid/cholesterol/gamma-HCH transport system ATP-binding protein